MDLPGKDLEYAENYRMITVQQGNKGSKKNIK
jgi:hypothetical protein